MPSVTEVDVAIIGGGFTGAVFAIHLSREIERPLDIAIIEPRDRPGRGIAYDTPDPDHRLNGPLPVHFVYPDQPDHLQHWYGERSYLEQDPDAQTADGQLFIRRSVFGSYVEEQLGTHATNNPSGSRIEHIRSCAVSARKISGRFRISLDCGRAIGSRMVVLAAGYKTPQAPSGLDKLALTHPAFISNPWDTLRIRQIPSHSRILLLGMAQTASDVIATLLRSGHKGSIKVVSRHGLRPRRRPQAAFSQTQSFVDRVDRDPSLFTQFHGRHATALSLLRTFRAAVRRTEAAGGSWVEPLGDLRDSLRDVWSALPMTEQQRVLRHLRVWYDVHRFQLPPQIETLIGIAEESGQLSFEAARCEVAAGKDDSLSVLVRPRGSDGFRREHFDAIVNCTGPDMSFHEPGNPVLASLLTQGHIMPHPVGMGFHVDDRCRAIDRSGRPDEDLRIVGPLVYGALADQQGAAFITLSLYQLMPDIVASLQQKG